MRPILLYAVLGVLAISAPARAEESVTHDIARKHYEIGKSYYEIANYSQALDEFKKAYELQPLPGLLFNMGRCHEGLGDLKQAVAAYKLFLAKQPGSSERSLVELRVKNLERRLGEQRQPAASQATPPAKTPEPPPATIAAVPVEAAPTPAPSRWKRTAGWSAVGVGGASLVTGIVLGVLVRSKSRDYETAAAAGSTYFELNQIASSGRSYQKGEIAALAVGGVIAAGGLGLVLWDALGPRERGPSSSVRLMPIFGGGNVGVSGSVRF